MDTTKYIKQSLLYLSKASRRLSFAVGMLDPRIVRLREPRSRSPMMIAMAALAILLAIGAVSLASAKSAPAGGQSPVAAAKIVKAPSLADSQAIPKADDQVRKKNAPKKKATKKKARFYDPFYVFSETVIEGVAAYPLSDPPGIVVDLKGAAEKEGDVSNLVGTDDRIKSVRRLPTNSGLRYIIAVSTPLKRIELFHEGGVAMIFPVS